MKDISITFKEINRVICGDIYGLLCGLLENDQLQDQEMKVEDYDYYKLSGQSCKISLFTSLLKEYIPGKKLRAARREKRNEKIIQPGERSDRRIADETDSRICISDVSGTVVPAVLQSG